MSTLTQILHILQQLQKINNEFPLQYALCLIHVSMDEGISLTNLSERAMMPLSTTSRIIGALSTNRQKGKAYGLIQVRISASERRKKELYLTPKGKQTIDDLLCASDDRASKKA